MAEIHWRDLIEAAQSQRVPQTLDKNHRLLKFVPSPSAKIQFEIKHIFSNTLKTPALLGPNREETVMKQEKGKDGRD